MLHSVIILIVVACYIHMVVYIRRGKDYNIITVQVFETRKEAESIVAVESSQFHRDLIEITLHLFVFSLYHEYISTDKKEDFVALCYECVLKLNIPIHWIRGFLWHKTDFIEIYLRLGLLHIEHLHLIIADIVLSLREIVISGDLVEVDAGNVTVVGRYDDLKIIITLYFIII